jgi:hypothetical protein
LRPPLELPGYELTSRFRGRTEELSNVLAERAQAKLPRLSYALSSICFPQQSAM